MVVRSPPKFVPNEKTTLLTVVVDVMDAFSIVNTATWSSTGLCGPLPAMDEFALLYGPGPMIACEGAGPGTVPGQTAHRINSSSNVPSAQSVEPAPLSMTEPLLRTWIRSAELELSADTPVSPPSANSRP